MKKVDFAYCYGCGVCAVVCPKKAISIDINDDGFYIPIVDDTKCVDCGACLSVCAFNDSHVVQDTDFKISSFAAWSLDKKVRRMCTSGGVAFEFGRYLLQEGYSVIGCRYNPDEKIAEHYLAEKEEQLKEYVGSKYIQSRTFSAFSQIQKGHKYLITGTPCQIDSLRRLLRRRKMEDDVVLLDFFCHGVPSMLMWNKYVKELEQKIGTLDYIVWRDKERGWHDSYVMKAGNLHSSWFSKGDLFYQMFLGDRCLGKACYKNCKYKYNNSAADIRIGDLWGSVYANDEEGVNGVICFTPKGENLMKKMSSRLHIEPSTIEIVGESQLKKCAHQPISYSYVMKHLKKETSLFKIHKNASYIELIERIPRKLNYYFNRLPSKMMEIINRKK